VDLRIFIEPQQGASHEQQLAMAQAAEDGGFSGFFRSDHLMAMSGDGLPGPTESWVTLGALARETTRIRLGTMVTAVTFRHPGVLAIAVAQVDAMSGGRVELGLGAGWFEAEHLAHGVPFPPTGERLERLGEQLEILTGLWSTPIGERFSYQGRHYTVVDSPGLPKPVQQPHPPVILGGAGQRRTPALAAAHADEFNLPFHPLSAAAESFARVRQACERAGRDPGDLVYSAALTVCCGVDDAEIARRAQRIGRPPDRIDLAGTPGQLVEQLARWSDAGAERVYVQVLDLDDLEHVRLLAAEVLPRVG
jgi:F420-dependent oxidoreductase-like protein